MNHERKIHLTLFFFCISSFFDLGFCQSIRILNVLNKSDPAKEYIVPGETLKIIVSDTFTKPVDLLVDNNKLYSEIDFSSKEFDFKLEDLISAGVWSTFDSKEREKTMLLQLVSNDATEKSTVHGWTFVKHPDVDSVYSIIKNKQVIEFDEEFIVEMNHMNFIPKLSASNPPILYINNKPFYAIEGKANSQTKQIFFTLDVPVGEGQDDPWEIFVRQMDSEEGSGDLDIGVGLKDGSVSKNVFTATFRFFWVNKNVGNWILIIVFLIAFCIGFLGKGNFLRNEPDGSGNRPAYSYSKVQLYYWTMIILLSFFYISIQQGSLIELSRSNLALISIPPVTALLAKGLESTSGASFKAAKKGGFISVLKDIISDNNGVQLSRVQGLIFNLTFGSLFLATVCSDLIMIDFTPDQLILLGISASLYSAFKPFEK